MKRSFSCTAVSLILLSCWPIALASGAEPDRVRVLIIDGQNNHAWRQTTPFLKDVLEKSGRFTVEVSSNLQPKDKPGMVPTVPFPPDLAKYHVVISNYNGSAWPAAFRKTFEQRVRDGKLGFVLFHAANNCFADWPDFNQMVGMARSTEWAASGKVTVPIPDGFPTADKPSQVPEGKK